MVDESDKSSTDDAKTKIHVFSQRRIKKIIPIRKRGERVYTTAKFKRGSAGVHNGQMNLHKT